MARAFLPECRCQDKLEQARVLAYITELREAAGPEADAIARRRAWPNG